jgi:hypothetical protein
MSFASISGSPLTGAGLNYPCVAAKLTTTTPITLDVNKFYNITSNSGGNVEITLSPNASIGNWIGLCYWSSGEGDSITILGTPNSLENILPIVGCQFIYTSDGWLIVSVYGL